MKKQSSLKLLLFAFIFLLSLFVTTPNLAQAAYSTENLLTDQLLNTAQAKLDAEYKTLISGEAEDLTTAQTSLTGKAAEKGREIVDTQLRRNKGLAEHGQKRCLNIDSTDL